MYAGKIRLIGTESGVGVHNAGEIGASAGDITITADGMLMNSGQINSSQQLVVNTAADIENTGVLYAQGNTQLTTAGTLSNSGTLAAGGYLCPCGGGEQHPQFCSGGGCEVRQQRHYQWHTER